mmetsp:Transcript_2468/g.8812  ORF Transcript_2468/g.8812 Transcript_2468/m.8812 type:complete len:87 (+) Transcript_2468:1531-1791(+)
MALGGLAKLAELPLLDPFFNALGTRLGPRWEFPHVGLAPNFLIVIAPERHPGFQKTILEIIHRHGKPGRLRYFCWQCVFAPRSHVW